MIPVARPFFSNKEIILETIDKVLESGRLMDGEMTEAFEHKFARYICSKHAIAVNSCTTALEIVLRYIGVKGLEVIVPTNTFIATSNAVLFAGGIPVLADIKEESYNIDPDEIKRKITEKTKAVIVVHIAGIICDDIREIQQVCKRNGVYLIEDCAHAVGAMFKGKKAGSFGFAGCFSFYPTKIMTTGTGGMITTDSDDLNDFARSVRCHGRSEKGTSEITNFGNNWFMDEIRATVGLYQLSDLESMLNKRREIATRYCEELKKIEKIRVLPLSDDSVPAYYKFPVLLDNEINSDHFKERFLKEYDVELESVYWPTCHLQPVYRKMFGYKECDFPIAERILSQQITLPIHPLIDDNDISYVVSKLEVEL
jgi:perosamine synthetase